MPRIPQITRVKPRVAILIAWSAVASLIVAQQLTSLGLNSRLNIALHNAAHTPWFLILTALLWWATKPFFGSSLTPRFLFCLTLSVLLAPGLEAIQLLTSRNANVFDVLRNLAGAGAAYALIAAHHARKKSNWTGLILGVTIAAILLVSSYAQVLQVLRLQHRQVSMKPSILSFDDPEDPLLSRLRGNWEVVSGVAGWQGYEQENVALVRLDPSRRWPGVTLMEPTRDWSGYKTLVITTYLDAVKLLPMEIRLQTVANSGVATTASVNLKPGENLIYLSLFELVAGQSVSLEKVRNLFIFSGNPRAGDSFYLAAVHLQTGTGQ